MIVMIKTTNVNMDVAAENPGGKNRERHLLHQDLSFINNTRHVLRTRVASRWSRLPTRANSGEEEKPKQAEDRSSHHLVYSSRMDLLVQFRWQIRIIHVVSVCQVFQQHVHQPCTGNRGKPISKANPIRPTDKPLYKELNHCMLSVLYMFILL